MNGTRSTLSKRHDDEPITVLLADDHPLYRDGLVQALGARSDLDVVGETGDGSEALDLIRSVQPAIALVDLRLPSLDGIAIAEAVRKQALATKIVIVSAFEDRTTMLQAYDAGARGYLTKVVSPDVLYEAMSTVLRGGLAFPDSVRPRLTDAHRLERTRAATTGALTGRELEILRLVAQGMTAPEIANQLYLSVTTVRTHIQHVFDKFAAPDRAAAVATAARRGLLD